MKHRDRDRRPGRRAPFRDPKPLILIVCEGKVTEPEYLDGFRKAVANPRVHIEVVGGGGVPRTLVESAKSLKQSKDKLAKKSRDDNISYESVWCVFDVDDHPNIEDAKQMARDNGIELAISNPSIELWLLLHFRGNPGMQHRDRMKQMLKQFVPDYDKHVDFINEYLSGYSDAVRRAAQMDQQALADSDDGRNPTTGVYRLTEEIRGDQTL